MFPIVYDFNLTADQKMEKLSKFSDEERDVVKVAGVRKFSKANANNNFRSQSISRSSKKSTRYSTI